MTSVVTVNAAALTGGNRIVVVGANLGGDDTITGGAGDDTIIVAPATTPSAPAPEPTPSMAAQGRIRSPAVRVLTA